MCLVFYSIALYRHRRAPENAGIPQDGSPVRDEEKTHEMNDVPMYGAEQPTQYMA